VSQFLHTNDVCALVYHDVSVENKCISGLSYIYHYFNLYWCCEWICY